MWAVLILSWVIAQNTTAATFYATDNASLSNCNSAMNPGDTCIVSTGTYTQSIVPSASGTIYTCPSRVCTIKPASGNSLDLRNRSNTTVDGFTLETNAVLWGNGSANNSVKNIVVRARSELQTGCGSDNTLDGFVIDSTGETNSNALTIGWGSGGCSSTVRDQRATVRNGVIRGGRNNSINYCDSCTLDNLLFTGAWNHTLSIGDNGNSGCRNLMIRNSKFLASTSFREALPDVRDVSGLTLLNNLFTGYGVDLPGHNTPAVATGLIRIHNNVFVNYGTGSGEFSVWLTGGSTLASPGSATWDIDYNAYIPGPTQSTPAWKRDSLSYFTLPSWQALGFDQHSIVIGNGSFVYGPNAPLWGAIVECPVSPGSFDTRAAWAEGVAVGDTIEYDWDGTARTVTGTSPGSGGNCATRIAFTPALTVSPIAQRWFLDWKQSIGTGKTFVPQPGSAIIDAGNPFLCGHYVMGARCDIGPVEAGVIIPSLPECPPCSTTCYSIRCVGSACTFATAACSP